METQSVPGLLKQTYNQWNDHQAPRLGASVAFYSILSFAPLLVLLTALIAIVFGHTSAQNALVDEARQLIGDSGAETVQTLLKNAQKPASGVFASIIAFATLLFGASGVFTELQAALNLIWDAQAKAATGVVGLLRQRLLSFGMVLSIGFLLLVSLILSAGLAVLGRFFSDLVPIPPIVLQAVNFVISFLVVAGLFALMFKYLPAAKVSWRDVVVGAIGTALLFAVGKLLLGIYIGRASVGSTFGAAGSLVAAVVWIYYSAQIFFFGAEFTHVYSGRNQQKSKEAKEPGPQATAVPERREIFEQALANVSEPAPTFEVKTQPVPLPVRAGESQPAVARPGGAAVRTVAVLAIVAGYFLGRASGSGDRS